MQEKVRLLMEETGCDQGEAELALELTDNDLERAIRTIESLLRHIIAIKSKIIFSAKNQYGLLLIVVNTKTQEILRFRTVVSYNPSLYENSMLIDWYMLEKKIFSYRLDEGSLPDYTQEIEQKLQNYFLEHQEILFQANEGGLADVLRHFFKSEQIEVEVNIEELNLAQFRQLPESDIISNAKDVFYEQETGAVLLQVNVFEDENGKEVNKLNEGDVILSQITDDRDIAHYLAHLIGGKREGQMIPIPTVIRKVKISEDKSEIQVNYAPHIVGIARLENSIRVKIIEGKTEPWWKKLIPF